jgi:hypothetical protein
MQTCSFSNLGFFYIGCRVCAHEPPPKRRWSFRCTLNLFISSRVQAKSAANPCPNTHRNRLGLPINRILRSKPKTLQRPIVSAEKSDMLNNFNFFWSPCLGSRCIGHSPASSSIWQRLKSDQAASQLLLPRRSLADVEKTEGDATKCAIGEATKWVKEQIIYT